MVALAHKECPGISLRDVPGRNSPRAPVMSHRSRSPVKLEKTELTVKRPVIRHTSQNRASRRPGGPTLQHPRAPKPAVCADHRPDARSGKFGHRQDSQKFADELSRCDMDVSDFAPGVSSDRDEVAFRISGRMRGAGCVITRQALENHF